ncbi:hypothetical protein LTS18_008616 [Coniosporium uncinatum]|uniref:Uncharacterized protein n=1 Tax=Coniosporium uncinatum TaxID=93489 RepID=A0ACC3DA65_9PEZI|nr:hypothetical protein LTS18_008616 [Coniosporium uncinatum]
MPATTLRPSLAAVGIVWRKIYHPLGLEKGYNFPLFVVLVGGLMSFIFARFSYLDIDGFVKHYPERCYHYTLGVKRIGNILHLAGILPGGFPVCFQFVPVIRHKLILFHRLNGYLVILLFFIA